MDIIIIQRHFDRIVQHAKESYPAEAGGFLGGIGNLILGIFPVPNFAFLSFEEKQQFGVSENDNFRAAQFFEEYKMKVLGFYHSHPSSHIPIPSKQDIKAQSTRKLGLMMIVSLADLQGTMVTLFEMQGQMPAKRVLKVIKDDGVNKYLMELDIEKAKQKYLGEMKRLDDRVEQILKGK